MPPPSEYNKYLKGVWQRNILTNNGPLVVELEKCLARHLGTENTLYLSNGTVALQIAFKALKLTGEVITTPFSYVATTSSLVWQELKPVFVDIDNQTLNIDPNKIPDLITPKTSAILATHCFGNPCDVEAICDIAEKYKLKVIYDGAHCFGTKYKGTSIFNFGDICTASYHATKLFHTIEGGGVFSQDKSLYNVMSRMRNFGHAGPEHFETVGINGKNSELHAAMGLCNLKYINLILQSRREQSEIYDHYLDGENIDHQKILPDAEYNHCYYPVLFQNEQITLKVMRRLEQAQIYTRRYFYPALNSLPYLEKSADTPIADDVAKRILCLPVYHGLKESDQKSICRTIKMCKV